MNAVDAIVRDINSRSGGDEWWSSIDPDTQQEIKAAWARIIGGGPAPLGRRLTQEEIDGMCFFR